MCSDGTSSPVSSDTFWYLIRAIVRSSNWLNDTPLSRTAVYSLTGIEISPKLTDPLQIDLAMLRRYLVARHAAAWSGRRCQVAERSAVRTYIESSTMAGVSGA